MVPKQKSEALIVSLFSLLYLKSSSIQFHVLRYITAYKRP